MKCIVPDCGRDYTPEDPEDGADKCFECRKRSQEIAFKVDIEIGQRRANAPQLPTSRIRQLFSEEQILNGDLAGSPRLNMRDLGIGPSN